MSEITNKGVKISCSANDTKNKLIFLESLKTNYTKRQIKTR